MLPVSVCEFQVFSSVSEVNPFDGGSSDECVPGGRELVNELADDVNVSSARQLVGPSEELPGRPDEDAPAVDVEWGEVDDDSSEVIDVEESSVSEFSLDGSEVEIPDELVECPGVEEVEFEVSELASELSDSVPSVL